MKRQLLVGPGGPAAGMSSSFDRLPRRDLVRRLRLGRRRQARATVLHVERGQRPAVAAVEVLVIDDLTVVERGRAKIDDVDGERLYEVRLLGLAGCKLGLDLVGRPLPAIVAEQLGCEVHDVLGPDAPMAERSHAAAEAAAG